MALNFYIVNNEFEAWDGFKVVGCCLYGNGSYWGGYDDSVMANKEKGFYNHSATAITKEGFIYCIWKVKEGIST